MVGVPKDELEEVTKSLMKSAGVLALSRNIPGRNKAPDIKGIPMHDLEWIGHEAMKQVLSEDLDRGFFGAFSSGDIESTDASDIFDQWDNPGTKANAVLEKMNELIAQKYRVNRGEVVTSDGQVHALKGNMFDIIKYSTKKS